MGRQPFQSTFGFKCLVLTVSLVEVLVVGRLVAGEVLNDYDFRRTVCTVHLRVPVLLLQILHEWNVLHVIVELQYGLT